MRALLTTCALVMSLLLAPRVAVAQDKGEDPPSPGEQSMGLMTIFGLSGVRSMVDGRIPTQSMCRAFFRYVQDMESETSTVKEHSVASYGSGLTIGVPLWGRVEGGFFAPFYFSKQVTNRTFGQGGASSWFNPIWNGDVGGKAGGQLDWIDPSLKFLSLSPYVFSHVSDDVGLKRFGDYNVLEAGLAEGVAFLDERLAFNVNTAFVTLNDGKHAFRYRVGAMVVPPPATTDFVPRLSFYVDGLERGGTPGSDLRVAFAVQAIIVQTVLLDLNGEYRVFAGDLPAGLQDNGTGGFVASVGFRVSF